jgi:CBS-domain-containing membrane protein
MSRRDSYLDAMLKHLGATYYQTLEGEATSSDVDRAVASVREEMAHRPGQYPVLERGEHGRPAGRWRVRDVMRTDPVTAGQRTSVTDIARLMSDHRVSDMPVLADDGQVAGVVSEADLLRARRHQSAHMPGRAGQPGDTAAQLMTSPAISIGPDASLAAAARQMDQHRLRMLPVVDPDGRLLGVVSRRNLLSVFLRTDKEIASEVRSVLHNVLLLPGGSVRVSVRDGVVTLSGHVDADVTRRAAVELAHNVFAVVDVINKLTNPVSAGRAAAEPQL